MKKYLTPLFLCAIFAFLAGAIFYFIDGNETAGVMAAVASVCFTAAFILHLRDSRKS